MMTSISYWFNSESLWQLNSRVPLLVIIEEMFPFFWKMESGIGRSLIYSYFDECSTSGVRNLLFYGLTARAIELSRKVNQNVQINELESQTLKVDKMKSLYDCSYVRRCRTCKELREECDSTSWPDTNSCGVPIAKYDAFAQVHSLICAVCACVCARAIVVQKSCD